LLYSHRISRHASSRRFLWSGDEGATWSEPVTVCGEGYVSGGHDRFNVLSTGRLLAPIHCTDDWEKHYLHTRVARSDDGGRSWQVSPPLFVPQVVIPSRPGAESGCNEPGIAERADGTLLMTLRTAMGTQFCSESADGGVTWSPPRSLEVSSPSAPAHLSRIPGSSELLLVWTPHYDAAEPMNGHRHSLVACISTDGGRSWPAERRKVLVEDSSRNTDYPAVFYRDAEAWIVARQSDRAEVIQGRMSSVLLRVPLNRLYP
jgi:sialidase-1